MFISSRSGFERLFDRFYDSPSTTGAGGALLYERSDATGNEWQVQYATQHPRPHVEARAHFCSWHRELLVCAAPGDRIDATGLYADYSTYPAEAASAAGAAIVHYWDRHLIDDETGNIVTLNLSFDATAVELSAPTLFRHDFPVQTNTLEIVPNLNLTVEAQSNAPFLADSSIIQRFVHTNKIVFSLPATV